MEHWKYISQNTTHALSLHDCDCTRMYYENNKVILEMEWMEIMDYHPQNKYSKAHQSGEGVIELIEPKIITCQYDKSGVQKTLCDVEKLFFTNLTFLDFDETQMSTGYENKMFLIKACNDGIHDNVFLILHYQSSVVKFNKLNDISWFVDFQKNSLSVGNR